MLPDKTIFSEKGEFQRQLTRLNFKSQIMQMCASESGTQNGETFPRINWSSDRPWRRAGIWILLGPLGLAGVLPGGPVIF